MSYAHVSAGNTFSTFDKDGAVISLSLEETTADRLSLRLEAVNKTPFQLDNFVFQVAVTKAFQVKMFPPSGETVFPNEAGSITQNLTVQRILPGQMLKMRIKVNFVRSGQNLEHLIEVDSYYICKMKFPVNYGWFAAGDRVRNTKYDRFTHRIKHLKCLLHLKVKKACGLDRIPPESFKTPYILPPILQIIKYIPYLVRFVFAWIQCRLRGKKIFIDVLHPLLFKPIYGVPCGSLGSGSIGRDFRGGFCKFALCPGIVEQHVEQVPFDNV
ncbi:unnamed protein product [Soboliphyme baturini]|uniref:GAE domain-containing protein n=1 Tax=Soboliphyme baturini TaxID=241478 RepID=A0A3P8DXY6_9BILA|nr:unnamed protein product [Soboliphyme baturini]